MNLSSNSLDITDISNLSLLKNLDCHLLLSVNVVSLLNFAEGSLAKSFHEFVVSYLSPVDGHFQYKALLREVSGLSRLKV